MYSTGAWGEGPQRYMRRWLQLWMRYDRLKKAGVNVRMSPPELGWRGPFLIIGGAAAPAAQRTKTT